MTVLARSWKRLAVIVAASAAAAPVSAQLTGAPVATTAPAYNAAAPAYTPPVAGPAQRPMYSPAPQHHQPAAAPVAQPAYGQPAPTAAPRQLTQSQPAYGQPAYGQPAYSQPASTPPVVAAPAAAPVAASQPAYAAPSYSQPAYTPPAVTAPVAATPTPQPVVASQPAYGAPAYGQPAYQQPTATPPAYAPPVYAAPRVASAEASNLVTPITPSTPMAHEQIMTPNAVPNGHVAAPVAASWEGYTGGCATGDCGAGSCGVDPYSGPACDIGVGMPKPRRQWFAGLYYLALDRANIGKTQVAYLTETSGFTPGDDYYYQPHDTPLFTDDADFDTFHGAEVRFGSTFGPTNPCTCGPRFAWELAYWAIDDGWADAWLTPPAAVSSTNPYRVYGTIDYSGLDQDHDGTGAATPRDANDYNDYGVPADGDVTANDVRILAFRVRRRFQAQNLELNFWRFGTPECSTAACGVGGCGAGGCGGACGPTRPGRRFVINGLVGVRFFRFDDDLGSDGQFSIVDAAGDPTAGWDAEYVAFSTDENDVRIHDIEVDNQLVGLQLGCNMNWLIGCKWNLFADSNFGIYGNQVDVCQHVYGGGASEIYYRADGSPVASNSSETDVAFLGELRAGVGYQLTCRLRATAAYRFIGVGGVALTDSQLPDSGFANPGVVAHIDADDSLILHGLQLGAEYTY